MSSTNSFGELPNTQNRESAENIEEKVEVEVTAEDLTTPLKESKIPRPSPGSVSGRRKHINITAPPTRIPAPNTKKMGKENPKEVSLSSSLKKKQIREPTSDEIFQRNLERALSSGIDSIDSSSLPSSSKETNIKHTGWSPVKKPILTAEEEFCTTTKRQTCK